MKNYLFLLAFVIMLSVSLSVSISAWPYQLYSNGTLVDLNSSNNQTTNLTIYQITNITNNNITNNITNNTYDSNLTSYYTKTQTDNLLTTYLKRGEQYANTEVFNRDELTVKLNNLSAIDANITAQIKELNDVPVTWIWFAIFIVGVMASASLILWGKDNQQ